MTSPRRTFLKNSIKASAALACGPAFLRGKPRNSSALFNEFGLSAGFGAAPTAHKAGFQYLLAPTNRFLKPNEPEAAFEEQLRLQEKAAIPVKSCNSFLRGPALRSVGPEAKRENVFRFAETAFRRAQRADVHTIVFGSSGSRAKPEGWTKEQVDAEFIPLLQKMGPMAQAYDVTVAVENLAAMECNYLTLVSEVGEIVKEVNHPNVRVLADMYHASRMEEPADAFEKYAPLMSMVEIAEKDGRTAPGVNGQDFRPYFQALRRGGYRGPIEIEGKWQPEHLAPAIAEIRKQSA